MAIRCDRDSRSFQEAGFCDGGGMQTQGSIGNTALDNKRHKIIENRLTFAGQKEGFKQGVRVQVPPITCFRFATG